MSSLSKSPLRVAREALAVGECELRRYAHRFSPHKYTQPQLFACLVVKTFYNLDYRGIEATLKDSEDLRKVLGLNHVPHFTTLQKASNRLLAFQPAYKLLNRTVRRFYRRRRRLRRVAFDSTGLDYGQRSSYYVRRRNSSTKRWETVAYSRFAKLEAALDTDTHFIVGVLVSRGPKPDVNRFVPLLDETVRRMHPRSILADAGYDSEGNHRYAREQHGIRSFIPPEHGRPTTKLPSGRYRRLMKQRLNKHFGSYGQRWQVETGMSMIKRCITSVVQARNYWSQLRELLLLVLSYNIAILYAAAGFLQSNSRPLFPLSSSIWGAYFA